MRSAGWRDGQAKYGPMDDGHAGGLVPAFPVRHGLFFLFFCGAEGPLHRSRCGPDGLGLTPGWGRSERTDMSCEAWQQQTFLCRNGCVGYTLLLLFFTRAVPRNPTIADGTCSSVPLGRAHLVRTVTLGEESRRLRAVRTVYKLQVPCTDWGPSQGRPPLLLARWSVLGGKRPLISNSIINAVHFRCREFWPKVSPGVGMRPSAGSIRVVQTHFVCPSASILTGVRPRGHTHEVHQACILVLWQRGDSAHQRP